jgi:peptidoglycan/LPS O-acetylase OafA/YrhL
VGAILAAAFGVLLFLMASTVEVLDEGKLLPYTDGHIYRLRFFGFLEVYAEPSRRPDIPDVFTTFVLMTLSGVALVTAVALKWGRAAAEESAARFFLVVWVGAAYLGADELLGLHESLGHNMRFLLSVPGITRPDDLILLIYGMVALGVLIAFRDVVLSSRSARPLFVALICALVLVPIFDITGSFFEEPAEMAAVATMLAAFVVLAVDHLVPRRPAGSGPRGPAAAA